MPSLLSVSNEPDIVVASGTILVGRDPACDVCLFSLRISRRHCVLTALGADLIVWDLGSTNGTWVNGRRIDSARLVPGDEISLAHLRYYLEEAPTFRLDIPALKRTKQ
jgi:pSer/pThr/pTyr-binding forkhead associated (FHA) protein